MTLVTLPSSHKIWNLSASGLEPSMLPLGDGGFPRYWIVTGGRGKTFTFFETWIPRTREKLPSSGVTGDNDNHYINALDKFCLEFKLLWQHHTMCPDITTGLLQLKASMHNWCTHCKDSLRLLKTRTSWQVLENSTTAACNTRKTVTRGPALLPTWHRKLYQRS